MLYTGFYYLRYTQGKLTHQITHFARSPCSCKYACRPAPCRSGRHGEPSNRIVYVAPGKNVVIVRPGDGLDGNLMCALVLYVIPDSCPERSTTHPVHTDSLKLPQ